jgi:site-specific recombinase
MNFSPHNFAGITLFVSQARRIPSANEADLNVALRHMIDIRSRDQEFKKQLTEFVFLMMEQAFFVNAFTDYGIQSSREFFAEAYSRIKHKILPPNLPDNELSHFIVFLFPKKSDMEWLGKMDVANWTNLVALIDSEQIQSHAGKISQQVYNAIIILCHRLTAIGIDPYLVRKMPAIDDNNSPFFHLNRQVGIFVKKHLDDKTLQLDHDELMDVVNTIDRCEQIFTDIQNQKDTLGTSLHLTFLLKRAQQHIDRIRLLLRLFITRQYSNKITVISRLVKELVKAEHTKNSVRKFFKENTNLLVSRIVSHTSQKGESYIGFSKKDNFKLFKSAMGGGLVVVFLVYIKYLIHRLHLSLFFEGFLFGLNYGIGFVLMHLWHFTLATKQPAMTASYIAGNIGNPDAEVKPWQIFKQIIRSQFVSLFGNLVIVLPLCFLSEWAMKHYLHFSVFTPLQANVQMYLNHPFYSGSLVFAAIAGVALALSGVIIGYIDNKVVYSEVAQRIIKHPNFDPHYRLGKRRKLAAFVEKNAGAIIGNLFLGFALGMAGNIGAFIGIPFDIRHVTISSGNFAIALGSGFVTGRSFILTVFAGVFMIGIINIASSFLISFALACRSRNLSLMQSLKILVGVSK